MLRLSQFFTAALLGLALSAASVQATTDEKCDVGYFNADNGCKSGKGGGCKPCDEGTYQPQKGQKECIPADKGYYSPKGSSSPKACPKGTYNPLTKQSSESACKKCDAGTYAKNPGSSYCTKASPGYYVPNSGACDEEKCPAHKYSQEGATSCSPCPPGYDCSSEGCGSPKPCSPGSYNDKEGGHCQKCPAGTFSSQSGSESCCECCAGTFAAGEGNIMCKSCKDFSTTKIGSPAGSTSQGQCKVPTCKADYPTTTCSQSSQGKCPAPTGDVFPSPKPNGRRSWNDGCGIGLKRCQVPGILGTECVNTASDIESCGGCVNDAVSPGRDCTQIEGVHDVSCRVGRCAVTACSNGFEISGDGENCVPVLATRDLKATNKRRITRHLTFGH